MRIRERFNPRAPCGARRQSGALNQIPPAISTHAPLAGRDWSGLPSCSPGPYFNPRAPCGARPPPVRQSVQLAEFQPTRPLRGATGLWCPFVRASEISTHAPLAGRDAVPAQSGEGAADISTHAPLAGRDLRSRRRALQVCDFNPRAPCGARRLANLLRPRQSHFNPRAPCGARHNPYPQMPQKPIISTHAPLAGRD